MQAALAALHARPLDVLCLGRAGVDLYAVQKNTPLEEVTQFNKSVGGSPANIATAVARLGGKSGVISVVAILFVALFVTWLLYLSWPLLDSGPRVLRAAVVALLLAVLLGRMSG